MCAFKIFMCLHRCKSRVHRAGHRPARLFQFNINLLAYLSLLLFIRIFRSFKNLKLLELSRMCFTVQLSRFSAFLSNSNSDILSCCFLFVKNFFNFFQSLFCRFIFLSTAYLFYHRLSFFVKNFFQLFPSCSVIETEKEGFEPSRRANDLHP